MNAFAIAIAILTFGVAIPIPDASAVPPTKRLGPSRVHVSDDRSDKTTIADLISRRAEANRNCCAKLIQACPFAKAPSPSSNTEANSSQLRKIRPYWQRKRNG